MSVVTEQKELWNVRETSTRLGISERTLFSITSPRGSLKSLRIGTRVFYLPETVAAWLASQEQAAANKIVKQPPESLVNGD